MDGVIRHLLKDVVGVAKVVEAAANRSSAQRESARNTQPMTSSAPRSPARVAERPRNAEPAPSTPMRTGEDSTRRAARTPPPEIRRPMNEPAERANTAPANRNIDRQTRETRDSVDRATRESAERATRNPVDRISGGERPDADESVNRAARSNRDRQAIQDNFRSAVRNSADADRSMVRWDERNSDRLRTWEDRGDRIRSNYRRGGRSFYTNSWWRDRPVIGFSVGRGYGGLGRGNGYWGYQPWLGYQPYGYWWGRPSWQSLVGWFPGGYGWNDPYYYDYGRGGNVVYYDDRVVVNGQSVGTPSSFYESARALANVDPSQIDSNDRDWKPLGTFSMAIRRDEADPDRVVQLAVNKDGILSGTVFNHRSGNVYNVQGRVDRDTQRVAFTIGSDRNTVLETGLYNLTQEQTPVLVHFNPSQTDTYVLARLPEPEEGAQDTAERPMPEIAR